MYARHPSDGFTVFERGWLSSNNVLLHGAPGEGGVLVDASHVCHAAQTTALVRHALGGERLALLLNTHLHSDHCGGNATLAREFGCEIAIPPGQWHAVLAWDTEALSYAPTGQRCERFVPQRALLPGEDLVVGGRRWQALAAPGHDPHSLILFEPQARVLISADALWQRGFGVIFPELEGTRGFDDQEQVLDLIESLAPRHVVPGHGAPFDDVGAALVHARSRLAAFRADPQRHAHHAMKALTKYHLLEEGRSSWPQLLAWFEGAALYRRVWQNLGRPQGSLQAYARRVIAELVAAGVLVEREGVVENG